MMPAVSILVVTYAGHERNLRRALVGLTHQFYYNYEIIIVDDGSRETPPGDGFDYLRLREFGGGGLLWSTPHFTKKRDLFGFPGLPDKWEVLMLARFYLDDGCGVVTSSALSDSIGFGRNRGSHRRGWRLQEDWCYDHPPRFPDNPFVPRLLISWSDFNYGHQGTIYSSSGWEHWDDSKSNKRRTGGDGDVWEVGGGFKRCWILRLPANSRAYRMGIERHGEVTPA